MLGNAAHHQNLPTPRNCRKNGSPNTQYLITGNGDSSQTLIFVDNRDNPTADDQEQGKQIKLCRSFLGKQTGKNNGKSPISHQDCLNNNHRAVVDRKDTERQHGHSQHSAREINPRLQGRFREFAPPHEVKWQQQQ